MHNIYYLGPKNSYSFVLTKNIFPNSHDTPIPCESFEEIIHNTQKDGLGILPIENSITSDVHKSIDILFQDDFTIVGEGFLKIDLYLLGDSKGKLEDITDVYSHPKALEQCSQYIKKHGFIVHEVKSTSDGKTFVKESLHNALIGSKDLGEDENLRILDSHIGNTSENLTRFVCITKNTSLSLSTKHNKATIIFTLHHVPGALAKVLNKIASENLNITKIQSRPIPGTKWEYSFWIDVEKNDLTYDTLKNVFQDVTNQVKILGIYTKGAMYES